MKKISTLFLGALILSSVSVSKPANAGVMEVLKDYGIPCAIAVGFSAALVKQDGAMIGAAICAGVSAATYINKPEKFDDAKLKTFAEEAVSEVADERDIRVRAEVDARFEEMRRLLREVLAERLVKMEEDLKVEMEKKFKSGDFMPQLEARIEAKIKREVIAEGQARSKEMIGQIVDEVIRQVVAKPIATQNEE